MMILILKQNGMKQKKVITNELFKLMILAYNNCPLLIAVYVLFSFFLLARMWQETSNGHTGVFWKATIISVKNGTAFKCNLIRKYIISK